MDYKQNRIPFLKKYWVSSIGVFLLSQIVFIIFEKTGWAPNYRDIDGTIFGRITESSFFTEWFNFYEKSQFNLLTFFFAIFFLVPGIISAIKNLLSLSRHTTSSK